MARDDERQLMFDNSPYMAVHCCECGKLIGLFDTELKREGEGLLFRCVVHRSVLCYIPFEAFGQGVTLTGENILLVAVGELPGGFPGANKPDLS